MKSGKGQQGFRGRGGRAPQILLVFFCARALFCGIGSLDQIGLLDQSETVMVEPELKQIDKY